MASANRYLSVMRSLGSGYGICLPLQVSFHCLSSFWTIISWKLFFHSYCFHYFMVIIIFFLLIIISIFFWKIFVVITLFLRDSNFHIISFLNFILSSSVPLEYSLYRMCIVVVEIGMIGVFFECLLKTSLLSFNSPSFTVSISNFLWTLSSSSVVIIVLLFRLRKSRFSQQYAIYCHDDHPFPDISK